MAESYRRKVSREEADEGYLFVTKDRLGFFPPEGIAFRLDDGGRTRSAELESRACTCRGPERPHRHWFVRWPGLVAGEHVELVADGDAYRVRRRAPREGG